MNKLTPSGMRKRFHLASIQVDAIRAKSSPIRAERDALARETDARLKALNDQIKAIEAPLYDLDMERGMCARALAGGNGASRMGVAAEHCTAEEIEAARKG